MQIVPACRAEASAELLRQYEGPTAFAIPGNHDWIDGLETYTRHIQHKGWLGGWLLPQVGLYAPRCFCLLQAHVLGSITGVLCHVQVSFCNVLGPNPACFLSAYLFIPALPLLLLLAYSLSQDYL